MVNSLRPSDAYITFGNITIIGSDNGLSPDRRQAIIWTNAGILLIGPLGTDFSENLIEIHTFLFKKMHLKTSSGKRRPFCLRLNVLIPAYRCDFIGNFIRMPVDRSRDRWHWSNLHLPRSIWWSLSKRWLLRYQNVELWGQFQVK